MWVQIRGVSLDGIGLPHFLLLVRLGTRLGHVCSFGGRRQPRRSSAAALNIVSTREAAAAKMATGNATYAQPRSRVSFLTRTSMTITVATASTMTVIAIHHEPRVVPRSCSLLSSSMRRGYPWLVRQNGSRTLTDLLWVASIGAWLGTSTLIIWWSALAQRVWLSSMR